MKCEFEERTFEDYFKEEVSVRNRYVPGQVEENVIGFDLAILCIRDLWPPLPYRYCPGLRINWGWWDLPSRIFPPWKFNLFIQFKRPTFHKTLRSKYWPEWLRPYFAFALLPHQQKALEILDQKTEEKALVLYASPAFHKRVELFEAVKSKNIVERTNFVRPSEIKGHKTYTYVDAKENGKAFSEMKEVEYFDFNKEIIRLFSREGVVDSTDLSNLVKKIDEIFSELKELTRLYEISVQQFKEQVKVNSNLLSYFKISLFCTLIDLEWFIGI